MTILMCVDPPGAFTPPPPPPPFGNLSRAAQFGMTWSSRKNSAARWSRTSYAVQSSGPWNRTWMHLRR